MSSPISLSTPSSIVSSLAQPQPIIIYLSTPVSMIPMLTRSQSTTISLKVQDITIEDTVEDAIEDAIAYVLKTESTVWIINCDRCNERIRHVDYYNHIDYNCQVSHQKCENCDQKFERRIETQHETMCQFCSNTSYD
jgi:hypothetical protein